MILSVLDSGGIVPDMRLFNLQGMQAKSMNVKYPL